MGLVDKTIKQIKARLLKEGSGHDWFHTERVWRLAKHIQTTEGGNREFIEVAALLHCAAEHDLRTKLNEKIRSYTMSGILDVLEIPENWREQIISIAQLCRFKGKDTERPETLEAKIVQDANFLDVLGAIGLARAFAAGGYLGRSIHSPGLQIMPSCNKDEFLTNKNEGTTLNYIYQKPLEAIAYISTPTAKKIAEQRLGFTKAFLDQFYSEWDVKDLEEFA